jgi:hypothetical protein
VNKNREHTEQSRYDRDHAHARLLELEHSDLIELITLTSVSVRLQDYGRGCIHRLVHRLDEARTEWDVVVLYKQPFTEAVYSFATGSNVSALRRTIDPTPPQPIA